MQPPIPRPRLPYSREASPPPPLPIHEWRASTRRTCQGPPTLRPKKLTIPTPPQATYPTPPAPSRPTLHLDLPYTHSRPPCTTHTSPSPAGLPYTAAPDTAPTRLPYTSRSQLAHPTLRLPPTHLPYTRLPTLHHAPTPRTYTTHLHHTCRRPSSLPYTSPASKRCLQSTSRPISQPTYPTAPSLQRPIPSLPGSPTLYPIPRNNAQDASPKAKAPTPATSASPTKEPTLQPATSSPRPAYPIPAPAQTSRNHAQVPARKSVQVLQLFNHTSHLPVRPPSSVASGLSLGNLGEEGLTLSRS